MHLELQHVGYDKRNAVYPGHRLASFPGLHAQLLSLTVLQVTKAGRGGLGTRLDIGYVTVTQFEQRQLLQGWVCRLDQANVQVCMQASCTREGAGCTMLTASQMNI